MVEILDAQTFWAIRVFEFNEQTKEEFDIIYSSTQTSKRTHKTKILYPVQSHSY